MIFRNGKLVTQVFKTILKVEILGYMIQMDLF